MTKHARILAGVPDLNRSLFHATRFATGDPCALITIDGATTALVRDIDMPRARNAIEAQHFVTNNDLAPASGLSGDRMTATAQAAAECLKRAGASRVTTDRTLPYIFAHYIQQSGIEIDYDPDLGVMNRRAKDEREVEAMRDAQKMTEDAMSMALETIASASIGAGGVLMHEGEALTTERLDAEIDIYLLKRGYTTPGNIVSGGKHGADCHSRGAGKLRTSEPIIIDIFPQSKETRYCGDCTRTIVHGEIPDEIARMHKAVEEALRAGIKATRAGVAGEEVYKASIEVIERHGWKRALPPENPDPDFCSMQHGLGHGVGLEVHEPPLLDLGGPELVLGDALTIEPGLYHATFGGVRIEDLVIARDAGCENLNALPYGLSWG